jgi:hypothetical protein
MNLAQAALARLVIKEGESKRLIKEIHPVVLSRFKRVFRLDFTVAVVFLLSALPVFWVPMGFMYLRFYMWIASFLAFPLLRPPRGWMQGRS